MRSLENIQSNVAVAADFRKHDGVVRKEEAKSERIVSGKRDDNASISSQSLKAIETQSSAKALLAHVEALPDVRQDRINDVRQKLSDGYYNSQDFADSLADRLIKDFMS